METKFFIRTNAKVPFLAMTMNNYSLTKTFSLYRRCSTKSKVKICEDLAKLNDQRSAKLYILRFAYENKPATILTEYNPRKEQNKLRRHPKFALLRSLILK